MTPNGAAPDQKRTADPDQIKAEIDATRGQLARNVDELGARLDVPARARAPAGERARPRPGVPGRARARGTGEAGPARDTAVETYRELPSLVLGGAIAL